MHLQDLLKPLERYPYARLLKYFSLRIRFASSKRAHRIFVEHFSLFPRLAFHATCPLFSPNIYAYTYTHIHALHPVSSSFLPPFSRPPGIFRISSILIQSHDFLSGNLSPRDGLCSIPPTHLRSYESFSYLSSRAFSIPTSRPLSAGLLLRDKIKGPDEKGNDLRKRMGWVPFAVLREFKNSYIRRNIKKPSRGINLMERGRRSWRKRMIHFSSSSPAQLFLHFLGVKIPDFIKTLSYCFNMTVLYKEIPFL